MCAYLSKTEEKYSHAMNEVLKNAIKIQLGSYEQKKSLAYALFSL